MANSVANTDPSVGCDATTRSIACSRLKAPARIRRPPRPGASKIHSASLRRFSAARRSPKPPRPIQSGMTKPVSAGTARSGWLLSMLRSSVVPERGHAPMKSGRPTVPAKGDGRRLSQASVRGCQASASVGWAATTVAPTSGPPDTDHNLSRVGLVLPNVGRRLLRRACASQQVQRGQPPPRTDLDLAGPLDHEAAGGQRGARVPRAVTAAGDPRPQPAAVEGLLHARLARGRVTHVLEEAQFRAGPQHASQLRERDRL